MNRIYAVRYPTYGYYLDRELAERAYWAGRAAELLELKGIVNPRDFWNLARGVDPTTGEVLRPRQVEAKQSRAVYDVVVISPKSAAIAGLVDERIIEAHRESVRALLPSIETNAHIRIRSGEWHKTDAYRPTGNIAAGVWRHETTRLKDPFMHSHVAVVNLTKDPETGEWKALQAVEIYRNQKALSEQFRHELVPRLEVLGYGIRDTRHSFEIEGVSEGLIKRFSQRSKERDELTEWYKEAHGKHPTPAMTRELLRQYRDDKPKAPREEIREAQLARLTPHEHAQLIRLKEQALERQQIYEIIVPRPYEREPQGQIAAAEKPPPEMEKERVRNGRGIDLHDHVDPEAPAHHEHWNYGETPSYKSGYKVRL